MPLDLPSRSASKLSANRPKIVAAMLENPSVKQVQLTEVVGLLLKRGKITTEIATSLRSVAAEAVAEWQRTWHEGQENR